MHFKDFTNQFYQYPHQLSYSQLLRSHHASFEALDKTYETKLQNAEQPQTLPRRFNGKTLKNIFTQLKNKTSTELESFIDLNALNDATECEAIVHRPAPRGCNASVCNRAAMPNGDTASKAIQVFHSAKHRKIKVNMPDEFAIVRPEIRIRLTADEFENIEKSLEFTVCPRKELTEKEYVEIQKRGDNSLLTKDKNSLPEVQEGRVIEVYNVLKRVISTVKWRYKKCRASPETEQTNKKSTTPSYNCHCKKCEATLEKKNKSGCNCWKTEDETLFCLLKMEARENFKQIKQIEQELKIQRKALKVLNNKCTSLENVLLKSNAEKQDDNFANILDIYKTPIATERKQIKDTLNKMKIDESNQSPPSVDAGTNFSTNSKVTIKISNDARAAQDRLHPPVSDITNEECLPNCPNYPNKELSKSKDAAKSEEFLAAISTSRTDSVKQFVINECASECKSACSKVKIFTSKAKVILNNSPEDATPSQPTVHQQTDQERRADKVQSTNVNYRTNISSEYYLCNQPPTQKEVECLCPSKKSSFIVKLFRKKKCHVNCKCCTANVPDKKRCKYFLEKQKKSKKKGSK